MMRVCLVVLAALCCHAASAGTPDFAGIPAAAISSAEVRPIHGVAGCWTVDYATGEVAPGGPGRTLWVAYDNTTDSTLSGAAGPVDDPNYFRGDSLWMVREGLLDSLAFSIFNSDTSAGPMSSTDVQINFYDPNDIVLGTILLDDVAFDPALQPGEVALLTVENLQSENVNLPYACMYAIYLSDVQGGATEAGQAVYQVPTVGESPDMFYEGPEDISLGTHGWWFSGDPLANFYFAVNVENPGFLTAIWDTGPTHTVLDSGTETWIGYTSGDYPGCAQRWAAMPFEITAPKTTVTEMVLWWWMIVPPDFDDYTADHVNYIIWHRTGLNAPTAPDLFLEGELGPYVAGGRDYRAKPYADWVPYHTYDVNIELPVGDYWLTIYAEEGPGTAGHALAWESGGNYVPEDLEQEFMWRSCNFPDPGFEQYTAAGVEPGPEMTDPDDRWNLVYVLRGCPADLDGDGEVGLSDLGILLATYDKCPGDAGYDPVANLVENDPPDGCIDIADLGYLLAFYKCGAEE